MFTYFIERKKLGISIGVAFGVLVLAICIVSALVYKKRMKTDKRIASNKARNDGELLLNPFIMF